MSRLVRVLSKPVRQVKRVLGKPVGGNSSYGEFLPLNLVNAARLLYFYRLLEATAHVGGDVVECGVGHGRSFISIAMILRDRNSDKTLFGFDSFAGFPSVSPEDESPRDPKPGEYAVPIGLVRQRLSDSGLDEIALRGKVVLVKGPFSETLSHLEPKSISFINPDVDLYDSYRVCLKYLWPRLSVGGIVTFDEYIREAYAFPGAQKAIDEFLASAEYEMHKDDGYGKYYVVKQ